MDHKETTEELRETNEAINVGETITVKREGRFSIDLDELRHRLKRVGLSDADIALVLELGSPHDTVIVQVQDRVISQQGEGGTISAPRKGGRPRGEVVRLSIDVSPELNETLETLGKKLHGSKSDVLRKAITLMEVAVNAKEGKKKFGVAAPGQSLETEIVGL